MQPYAIRDLLVDLLGEAVNAMVTTEGASDPPERQYVAHGAVAWDCEQLTTHLLRLRPKVLDSRSERCAIVHDATVVVTLIRCHPTGTEKKPIPSADDLDEAGRQLAIDGQALWKGLTRAWAEGTWPAGIPCSRVTWGSLEPLAPSGGYAGWRVEASVRL